MKGLRIYSGLLLVLFLAGCPQWYELPEEQLEAAFVAAREDAKTAEASEISRNLIAITPHEPALVWDGEPGESRVLMVMWSDWDGYTQESVGETLLTPWNFWVTAAPELQHWCTANQPRCAYLDRRLEQLLGLPPHDGKDRFVAFWVEPDDLFRPSPDPEITDHEAELDFPRSPNFLTIHATHIAWFNALRATSYEDDGYPWTRLGYTYDWGRKDTDIGLSEFIIRAGAWVEIQEVTPTDAYCDCRE